MMQLRVSNADTQHFNAQGSRLIIVVVKIYVAAAAAVEALRKKERQDENSVYHQNWWLSEFHPPLNANVISLV